MNSPHLVGQSSEVNGKTSNRGNSFGGVRSPDLSPFDDGKSIERDGYKIGMSAKFTVQSFWARNGEVAVQVTDPNGGTEEVEAVPNGDKLEVCSVTCQPREPGLCGVSILFAASHIQGGPCIGGVRLIRPE